MSINTGLNVGDIRHLTSTFVIPILEENMSDIKQSFRYLKSSNIDNRVHSDIRYQNIFLHLRIELKLLNFKCKPLSHCANLWCWISNTGYKFMPISDIISDFALYSQCQPMDIKVFEKKSQHVTFTWVGLSVKKILKWIILKLFTLCIWFWSHLTLLHVHLRCCRK